MSKKTFSFFDKIITQRNLIFLGLVASLIVTTFDYWDFLEPVIGIMTLSFVGSSWWANQKAKRAYYEDNSNSDDRHVVALEVGRPVSEAVKSQFGHLDVLVRVEDVIGTTVLVTDDHYRQVSQSVYSACARNQNRPIDLIVSGPNALVFLVGQMVGMDRFKIRVWQYYNGEYQSVPMVARDWLNHRN